jgi:hypothetical protein
MQSTLPLFDATLAISDTEFASISGLSIAGGVGLAGLGSGGIWLWCAGATAGPVGLLLAGGATAAAFGAAAVFEGIKWGKKQRLERESFSCSVVFCSVPFCSILFSTLVLAGYAKLT